jgi:hypothetical protein
MVAVRRSLAELVRDEREFRAWYDQVAPRVYADAGNITPYLHGAALPGVFGALFGSSLDSSDQAHNNHPLGATISGFAQNHSDPGRLRVSIQRGRLFAAE